MKLYYSNESERFSPMRMGMTEEMILGEIRYLSGSLYNYVNDVDKNFISWKTIETFSKRLEETIRFRKEGKVKEI